MKSYLNLTTNDLLEQERLNFSAHMALFYRYLDSHKMSFKDFNDFLGNSVSQGWKDEVQSLEDFMNGILLNVLANGGEVISVNKESNNNKITIIVSDILASDIMKSLGATNEMLGLLWDKYHTIAKKIGYAFSWSKTIDECYRIEISNIS